MGFWDLFDQPLTLPASLKIISLSGGRHSHPLDLPPGLQELCWHLDDYEGLALPEGLQKLTWGSDCNVVLPLGLRELSLESDAPLVFPEGLVKVSFDNASQGHYNLPESVQEVSWSVYSERIFTHPSTLQLLILQLPLTSLR